MAFAGVQPLGCFKAAGAVTLTEQAKAWTPTKPNMFPTTTFGLILLAIALWLMWSHWHRRDGADPGPEDEMHASFLRSRFRRQMQSSAMVGFVAVAILVSPLFVTPGQTSPLIAAAYWGGVALVVSWAGLLAVLDFLVARSYYVRLQRQNLHARTSLEAEARRMARRENNGNAGGNGKRRRTNRKK